MSARLTAGPGEVHLWYVRPESISTADHLDRCLQTLNEEERQQQARFVFARDRHLYLVAHAAVRTCLSRYAEVPPQEWAFVRNQYGRPEIVEPKLAGRLCFNLSHTQGMALLGITWDRELGVDVEYTERTGQTVELADDFFARAEVAELRRLPAWRRRERFFELWTLKEAYIKARGMGLAIPLDQFAYRLVERSPIGIDFAPELADDPRSWQFALLKLSPVHQAAVAVRRRPLEPDLHLVSQGSPLDGWLFA